MQAGERAAGELIFNFGGPPAPGTPTASFSTSVAVGAAPLDVAFSDISSQMPTAWSWDFGHGGTSANQNPNHQYTTPGDYFVSLTATNPNGSHTRVQPLLISVPEPSAHAGLVGGILGLLAMRAHRRQFANQRM
jgi:PKD repeat protein